MNRITCTAAGDAMILRNLPGEYEGFPALAEFIRRGDFRFVNLETTIHRWESCGNAVSGGSWFCSDPSVLEDLKAFGFNAVSTCNNHAMDFTHKGLELTLDYVRASGLKNAGVGRSLREASAPAYVETPNGRVAYLALCSSYSADAPAGEQNAYLPGRPGLNPLGTRTEYGVTEAQLEVLRQIARETGINREDDKSREQGYLPPLEEGEFAFGKLRFRAGEPGTRTSLNQKDLARTLRGIAEARYMADYVVVCVHCHEPGTGGIEDPPDFLREFAHRVIDAGADAVIGTGPHLLQPIELYKGRPVFYCLGDFVMQLENAERAPADFFAKAGIPADSGMDELYTARSDGGKKGLFYTPVMFESVVPCWEAEDGRLTRLTLLPVEEGFGLGHSRAGWPRFAPDKGILERLAEMSRPFGTKITIRGGMGIVEP